jgi:hypothetical protein
MVEESGGRLKEKLAGVALTSTESNLIEWKLLVDGFRFHEMANLQVRYITKF